MIKVDKQQQRLYDNWKVNEVFEGREEYKELNRRQKTVYRKRRRESLGCHHCNRDLVNNTMIDKTIKMDDRYVKKSFHEGCWKKHQVYERQKRILEGTFTKLESVEPKSPVLVCGACSQEITASSNWEVKNNNIYHIGCLFTGDKDA